MNGKHSCSAHKKRAFLNIAFMLAGTISACGPASAPRDQQAPTIDQITTSSQGFSIDCVPTSMTVTARITDSSDVAQAALWYRVGADGAYASRDMDLSDGLYGATIRALDLQVGTYGTLEFYITAEDSAGNKSQSPLDETVQFLPCVGS